MIRTPVSSSNLASVGYDPDSHVLEIAFRSGGIYQYFQVPWPVVSSLMAAGSKGSYFANNIKNSYSYRKVG